MTAPQASTRTVPVALLPAAAFVLACLLGATGCSSTGGPAPSAGDQAAVAATEPVESMASGPGPAPIATVEPPPPADEPAPPTVTVESEGEEPEDVTEGMAGPLEQALAECDLAREAWRQGAFDEALAALDRAYGVLLQMPDNGDPIKAQEKADLRHLISRRVVEIYASRQTAVGELDRAIPLVMNPNVEAEIRSFQGGERSFFIDSYRRSGLYRPMILAELEKAGLPEQLSWLPLIESGYKVRALSTARALGLWQFISSTGYRYGLRRDSWVDERMDPEKATRAAIAYLTELHGLFGDWLTAIAAYNCGEQNVLRTINSQKINYLDQFWDLYARLPRETARYVPRFLATLHIVSEPARYGFDLPEPYQPAPFELVQVNRSVRLKELESSLGLADGALEELNPELRHRSTPKGSYDLRVPPATGTRVTAALGSLPQWTPPVEEVGVHRVRSGETLSTIARRHGTSVDRLMRLNNLSNPNRLSVGQRLRVPQRGGGGYTAAAVAATAQPGGAEAPASGTTIRHTVRRGENLWQLGERYRTTVERIRQENQLPSTRLRVGQTLTITVGGGSQEAATGTGSYVVRSGDTPSSIARAHGVDLDRLLAVNGLSRRSTIYPGQTLVIP